ncbi:hypothetical protein GW891_03610 [bacterium]|nr:hypothetical protein [bacterium]
MGCGCKGDKVSPQIENEEKTKLTLGGQLLKILTIILLSILIIVLSPILLIISWYIAFRAVFSDNFNIVNFILKHFTILYSDKEFNKDDFNEQEFNEDNYEIVGVDVIK